VNQDSLEKGHLAARYPNALPAALAYGLDLISIALGAQASLTLAIGKRQGKPKT
jgi:hypothetical protein